MTDVGGPASLDLLDVSPSLGRWSGLCKKSGWAEPCELASNSPPPWWALRVSQKQLPSWFPLQFLLVFLPSLPSAIDLLPETIGRNRPLPSRSCLWSECSITAMESKLKQVLSCLTQAAYRSHPNLPRSQKQATAGGKSDQAHQRKKDIRKDLDKCQTLASLCPCLEGMTYYFPTLMCNSRQGVPPAMP